jgi:hypothetical protein
VKESGPILTGKDDAQARRMTGDRIDFISAYCDSWCERCAFTSRCSAFAARAAIAMCGDVVQGLELAIGRPLSAEPDAEHPPVPEWLSGIENADISDEEAARWEKDEEQRRVRLQGTPVMRAARALSDLSRDWLAARAAVLSEGADDVLREALEVAQYDVYLFQVKLYRALDGRDLKDDELLGDDHPIQNDWNGSAKVALISIERSEAAWRVIAASTSEETPRAIADQFRDLRREVEQEFPNAWKFIRPGFDEPGR